MKKFFKRFIKRFKLQFYLMGKKSPIHTYEEDAVTYEKTCFKICLKLISNLDSEFMIAPMSGKRYIRNEELNMFITLATSNGDQFVQNIPVTELQNNLGGSANIVNSNGIWGIAPRNIVWTKSFIFFPIGGFTTNTVAQFNIFYNV